MNWERQLIREQIGAGALSKTLAPYEFLADNGVFITQAGHVAAVLQIESVPFECSDQEQLDSLARRWEAALRVIDPEMRVYQYAIRREVDSTPHREVENRVLQHATKERLRYLHKEKGPLYSIDVFLVVVYELRRTGTFRMPEAGMGRIDQVTRTAAHLLTTALTSLIDNLNGVARLEILSDQKAFLFMRRLLNYAPEISDSQILHRAWDLNWQLADSSIECDGPLKVDRYFVRVLTLKEPPQQTYAHLLRELYELPCNAILATEWKPMPPLETNKAIRKMRRHLNHLQTSLTNHLGKNPPKDHEILVDMGKQALIQQLGKALEEIQMNNTYFGEFSLTILLYAEDPAVLRTAAAKAANALHPHGAALAEHVGKSALAAWLACVPGNQRFNVRRLRISNVNYADLSFLFGPHRGSSRNSHLQDESLAVFTTNQDTVFHFNFHVGQVGHSIITAQTGAGKTYLGKFLFTQTLKHNPYLVVFDITRTFQGLLRELGGSYIELGQEASARINPFYLPPTAENFSFLYSLVRMLLESDGGPPLTNEEMADLFNQVQSIYQLPGHVRRLGTLRLMPHLDVRLGRWISKGGKVGQYAHLFDNEEDTITTSDIQAFSFPQIKQDREAVEAMLFYTLHRSLQRIWATDRPGFVFFDEAVSFLQHPATRAYILDALLSFRKRNASIILFIHSLANMDPEFARKVIESCPTRLHGANPGIDKQAWVDFFGLTATEAEKITRLVPARQWLKQGSGVLNLVCDPVSHKLYSTSMEVQ